LRSVLLSSPSQSKPKLLCVQDGNGRLGRIIASIPLMRAGYPPIAIELERRTEYYKAINKVNAVLAFFRCLTIYLLQRLTRTITAHLLILLSVVCRALLGL
jgi:hypothetical protein